MEKTNFINFDVIIDLAPKTTLSEIICWILTWKKCKNLTWRSCANTLLRNYILLYYLESLVYLVNEKLRWLHFCFCLYFSDLPAISINPYVNVSLEYSDTQGNKPLEPVFKCLFDEPDDNPYWYDTYWYINTDVVKLVASQPFMSNQSWLYPKDWVDMYDLNMVVRHLNIYIFWWF